MATLAHEDESSSQIYMEKTQKMRHKGIKILGEFLAKKVAKSAKLSETAKNIIVHEITKTDTTLCHFILSILCNTKQKTPQP